MKAIMVSQLASLSDNAAAAVPHLSILTCTLTQNTKFRCQNVVTQLMMSNQAHKMIHRAHMDHQDNGTLHS